ncbi:MAG: hypothetical protein M1457_01615, partial [bacterium]|nr:hypothetical protein [bacterium]
MPIDLTPYLDDLEERIDPDAEESLYRQWAAFLDGNAAGVGAGGGSPHRDAIFSPRRPKPSPPRLPWPAVTVNRALDDFDAMALAQLRTCSDNLAAGTGRPLTVRANYGTCIMPSLFGAELFVMGAAL